MNLTPTQRKRLLKRHGRTVQALATEAGVSWRMARYWLDGEKTSANVAAAFVRLTMVAPERKAS